MTTRTFMTKELFEMGLPDKCAALLEDTIIDHTRWSVAHKVIFRLPDQVDDAAWCVYYSIGATENQDESPWEYDETVEATLVVKVSKVVTIWEPK